MLSVMFTVLFLCMGRAYPAVRGIRSFVCAFLLGIPCTFLLLSRGHIAPIFSVVLADLLSIACFLLFYNGILRFTGGVPRFKQPRIKLISAMAVIAFAAVVYTTEVRPAAVLRIAAMGLFASLMRALTARELLRRRDAVRNNNAVMRFFGIFLAVLSALGAIRVAIALLTGAPDQWTQKNGALTPALLLNVACIGVYGLCFLTMAGHELILRSLEESEKDLLSGAFNRRGIESRLAVELKRSDRSRHRLCVALVDIDHFKRINDRHGHATGDDAIRETATAIAHSLRDNDYLGRYGGDEFLIILPMTAGSQAIRAGERLSQAVRAVSLPGKSLSLTLSIGLTEASPEDDVISLIARADEALYRAKNDGRDCIRMLDPQTTFPDLPVPYLVRAAAQ